MKLHLRIAVYRGGAYWKECWESVKENLDLFDGVYISINQSELQEEDIATVRDLRSDKIHLLCQEKYLTAAQHGIVMNNWLKKFHLDGYVYILCHDDILVREGLLELRAMPLQETDAVFCGAHFFSSDGSEVPDPSQEADYTFPVSPEKFVLIHGRLSLNISRLVVPATLFHSKDVRRRLERMRLCFSMGEHHYPGFYNANPSPPFSAVSSVAIRAFCCSTIHARLH